MANHLQIPLSEWDARFIIEALKELERKWEAIIDASADEDVQADYGNNLVFLSETKDRFTDAAKSLFGEKVARFDRTPL